MLPFALAILLTCTPTALLDLAIPKWKADKNFRVEDAYKWTYQATRGGEHAIPDKESAREWLESEWQSLDTPKGDEAMWEALCSGGGIGRLNLRPYKAKGGKVDDLLEAFLASSRDYKSEQSSFVDAWRELGKKLKKKDAGRLDYKSWAKLDAEMEAKNYPAIHHSKTYEEARHPAYRVLTRVEYEELMKRLK